MFFSSKCEIVSTVESTIVFLCKTNKFHLHISCTFNNEARPILERVSFRNILGNIIKLTLQGYA